MENTINFTTYKKYCSVYGLKEGHASSLIEYLELEQEFEEEFEAIMDDYDEMYGNEFY